MDYLLTQWLLWLLSYYRGRETMNSIKHMRAFPAALAVLAVTISAVVSIPSAYARDCPRGYTCFSDWEYKQNHVSEWGKIQGDNDNWHAFHWEDRADHFVNHGRTHNNCLYIHAKGDPRGRNNSNGYLLIKGLELMGPYWRNKISSNVWTRRYGC
jgi:hypothetical protein